jgi:hypothetical protein
MKIIPLSQATLLRASATSFSIFEYSNKKLKVHIESVFEVIRELGFYARDGMVVREHNNIIEEIKSPQQIHKYVFEYVDNVGEYEFIDDKGIAQHFSQKDFSNKWLEYAVKFNFVSNALLNKLPTHVTPLLADKKDVVYIPFSNGVLEITKKSAKLIKYEDLGMCIWNTHIIGFEFNPTCKKVKSEYAKFIWNLSGKNKEVEGKIRYALGYLIHSYSIKSKNRVVLLYDKAKTIGKHGGVGKDLLLRGISFIRKCVIIDGKSWKPTSSEFFYQLINEDTQVVIISDPEHQQQFNELFVKSQGPLIISRKHKDQLVIDGPRLPKFAIPSNKLFDMSDSSNRRRQLPVILDGYYRDMGVDEPVVKEHGCEFYDEWNKDEWSKFYSTIIEIVQSYLGSPTPRIEFDDLIKQRFEIKYGLMGKHIMEYVLPKCPKLIALKDLTDSYIDMYIDLPDGEEGAKERNVIAYKIGGALNEWLNSHSNYEYEKKKIHYTRDDGSKSKQLVYKILDKNAKK